VKLNAQQVERFLRQPSVPTVLVYGPDQGLVRERAERLIGSVLDDPQDPFRLSELDADVLRGDPGRLLDEARALCLVGGRRVVRLRQASDHATAACRALLATLPLEALVVIDAGELGPGSSLRRLVEGARNAAAIACYRDEGRDLGALIDRLAAADGLQLEPDARAYLVEHLGADRGVTRSELAKLALYCAASAEGRPAPGRVTLEAAALVVGDSAALELDDLVHAAAQGEVPQLERCLDRLLGEGQAPVALLRALARHLVRLHQLALRVEAGAPPDEVVERARPPIHFRRKASVRQALRGWPAARLAHALRRLLEAEIGCKTTGWPAEALCRRALLGVCLEARTAAGGRRRAG
jgi:DNA polymerase-3 subunit delta